MAALEGGAVRFGGIRRRVPGITPKMLSGVLNQLGRDGLVERRQYAVIPPRVEYELTDLGRRFGGLLSLLTILADEARELIETSRLRYDTDVGLNEANYMPPALVKPELRRRPAGERTAA
jgi:DNA-binding HxlR family transcriptional regulator